MPNRVFGCSMFDTGKRILNYMTKAQGNLRVGSTVKHRSEKLQHVEGMGFSFFLLNNNFIEFVGLRYSNAQLMVK